MCFCVFVPNCSKYLEKGDKFGLYKTIYERNKEFK